ncbi:MAG: hypothetical protein HKN85_00120 [Gammaproteobacteria bacterium]|nr:hypothetical protein [Gammaproteobacteria bacterium]
MNSFAKIAGIIFSLIVVVFAANVVAAQEEFTLKGDRKPGTKFRSIDAVSPIPFDKTYDELTEQQKEVFRATYGGLAENEKPPFPKTGVQAIYKPIIKGHKEIARAGNLFLVAMIDEKGKVESVSVYESPATSMTEYATTVLFNTDFEPATCSGKPCKMEFPFEFDLRHYEKEKKGLLNN